MNTKANQVPTAKKAQTTTPSAKMKVSEKSATPSATTATPKETKVTIEAEVKKMDRSLKTSGKSKVKKLETATILAEKFELVSDKYDELTNFIAGKDNNNSNMKFASEQGYSFTLHNPQIVNKILLMVESEFCDIVDSAEDALLKFEI
jgi:hypothetical protein